MKKIKEVWELEEGEHIFSGSFYPKEVIWVNPHPDSSRYLCLKLKTIFDDPEYSNATQAPNNRYFVVSKVYAEWLATFEYADVCYFSAYCPSNKRRSMRNYYIKRKAAKESVKYEGTRWDQT